MKNQKGQVMLITVLVLMSTFALAITIGGLVLYDLRAMISVGESAKAIYAAESCVEASLYKINKNGSITLPEMDNGTSYEKTDLASGLRCVGTSGRVNRAFEIRY